LIVLVIVGGGLGVWRLVEHASAGNNTITGTFTLTDSSSNYSTLSDGQSCTGNSGYNDIAAGTEVQVSNQAGTILATSSLGAGTIQSGTCGFPFSVSHVPNASFYQIEVSHRGYVTLSKSELQNNDWTAGLALGN
jgi:hypothetical protein